jgi:hypothetical protein
LSEEVEKMMRSRKFDQLNGRLYTIVDARLPIDDSLVLGTCYWEEGSQEPVILICSYTTQSTQLSSFFAFSGNNLAPSQQNSLFGLGGHNEL